MNIFMGELIGTMLLVLLGDGVVANVLLAKTKGNNSGWIVITAGWGFGVAVAVYTAGWASGGHINPAITVAMAALGKIGPEQVPAYLAGQFLGGFLGAVLVWLAYLPHWPLTDDPQAKLSVFCTGPAVRDPRANFLCEVIGTAVLTMGALGIANKYNEVGNGLGPYLVGILVFSIGLSLGGPTGYAINPARDLAPRLAHSLLPIPGKGSSDWAYAWVPVAGPILGALVGALVYSLAFGLLARPITP